MDYLVFHFLVSMSSKSRRTEPSIIISDDVCLGISYDPVWAVTRFTSRPCVSPSDSIAWSFSLVRGV
jgi:hypothetical protein